jgi:ADP-ribose pyrophosphatase YjhB (NUDIX family)
MDIYGVSGSAVPCVGAVITDSRGRLLLIKRGHEPGAGLWSLPGGRIEPGETDAEALIREMLEETGLTVEPGRLLGRVQRRGVGDDVIDIRDYAATVVGGTPETLRAGDDAADARWVAAAELARLELTEGLAEILTEWGVLGPERPLLSCFSGCHHGSPFTGFKGCSVALTAFLLGKVWRSSAKTRLPRARVNGSRWGGRSGHGWAAGVFVPVPAGAAGFATLRGKEVDAGQRPYRVRRTCPARPASSERFIGRTMARAVLTRGRAAGLDTGT